MMIEAIGQAETGMPVQLVVTLIVGILSALGVGGFAGKKIQEAREVTVKPNPLPVSLVNQLATKEEVEEVEVRLGGHIDEIKAAISEDRRVARESLGKTHGRIDKVAENLAGVQGEMRALNRNIERALDK